MSRAGRIDRAVGVEGPEPEPPTLENGDRLDQPTFHTRYEAMPEDTRAELIGGIVYLMASPVKRAHGRAHMLTSHWVLSYEDDTPGVEALDNTTNILGPESEPQPDVCLLIAPGHGGQTTERDGYVVGAPELVVEVAVSTESIDLHAKKADYEKFGVREYIVVALRQRRVFWFVLQGEQFHELAPGADGIYRSGCFPGLWLDPIALLSENKQRLREVLNAGLASTEHTEFVARLAAFKQEKAP
ncbi:MAG: Uma2 family endonuclease [Gemmataceae bacterium]